MDRPASGAATAGGGGSAWSPKQISIGCAWTSRMMIDAGLHEAIYQSLYVKAVARCGRSSLLACAPAGLCASRARGLVAGRAS